MHVKHLPVVVPVALAVAFATVAHGQDERGAPDRRDTLLAPHGLSLRDAEPAFVTPSGKRLLVTQNASVACLTDADGSGHCAPLSRLREGLGFGGELCRADLPAHAVRLTGIVPPGVERVTLVLGAGRYEAAPVRGTVAFEVPRADVGDAVDVELHRPDGTVERVGVPQPPIVAAARCG